jgi:hypothetical protein
MLTDRLRSEIIKQGFFRVLERGQMNQILEEQAFQQTGCVASECVVQIGQLLGADYIVQGSVGKAQDVWSFSVKLVNVETGAIESSVDEAMEEKLAVVLNGLMPNLAVRLVKSVSGESKSVLASFGEGELFVKTEPAGARVWLDDELKPGVTPLSLTKIPSGKHVVRARLDSLGVQLVVEVRPNDLLRIEPKLVKLTGDIRVTSDPIEAEVWLDDSLWPERTPTILRGIALGNHTVKINKTGYVSWNNTVTAEYMQQGQVQVKLEQGFTLKLSLARKPVLWSLDGQVRPPLMGDTVFNLAADKLHPIRMRAKSVNDQIFYQLDQQVTGKSGEEVTVRYENILDSAFVVALRKKNASFFRWSLFGLSAVSSVLAYKFNMDQVKAHDAYAALPQESSQASFDQAWANVASNRSKFTATSVASLVFLAWFGATFAF